MAVHIMSMESDIVVDDVVEGGGRSTGAGLRDTPVGRSFEDLAAAVAWLSRDHGLPEDVSEYQVGPDGTLSTEVQRANHSHAQNGGWFEPTADEVAAWQRGELELYSEIVWIRTVGVRAEERCGAEAA